MTWNVMSHEVKEFKNFLKNKSGEIIGFTLSGMTYDGDGNEQWVDGTDMDIVFESNTELKKLLQLVKSMVE